MCLIACWQLGALHLYLAAFLSTRVLVKWGLRWHQPLPGWIVEEVSTVLLVAAAAVYYWWRPLVAGIAVTAEAVQRILSEDGSLVLATLCCSVVGIHVVWGGLYR